MGDQNSILPAPEARHLLRRAGFGAQPRDVDRIVAAGMTRGEAADDLIDFKPTHFKPRGRYMSDSHNKWVKYMIRTKNALQEKLVLFWHDHFATNYAKVQDQDLMVQQNFLFRQFCKGNFKDFVKAMNKDGAMMDFLDTITNKKKQPNENYPRELQELFTLGVFDLLGQPNYAQEDIVQIARAFSGWRYDDKDGAFLRESQHDFGDAQEGWNPPRGPKTIYKNRPGFGASGRDIEENGQGAVEIDTVIDIIFDHVDSGGHKTVARYITHKLMTFFMYADPDLSVVDDVIAASQFDTNWEIAGVLREMFVHDAFYESLSDPAKKSVKWPVDYTVTTLRLLKMKLKSKYQYVNGGDYAAIDDQLTNMGQELFEPPSVFGWDWETAWLSSATLLARYGLARDLMMSRDKGGTAFRPDKLFTLSAATKADDIVDEVTTLLGVVDDISSAERNALIDYVSDGGSAQTTLDLTDYDTRNAKLNGLVALVLQSPAYQVH
jgi:uncharacterized protein (DUF1800 family)